jgi:type IV pilus assembly protein PilA
MFMKDVARAVTHPARWVTFLGPRQRSRQNKPIKILERVLLGARVLPPEPWQGGTPMALWTRFRKGFTLIELMIVVAIIGVLAAIAIPNFLKFQCKSKTSEAKNMLKGIYTANVAYSGETESFSSDIVLFGLDLQNASGDTGNGKYYTFTVAATSTDFQATATPTNPIHGVWNIGYFEANNADNGMVMNSTTYCP